METIISLSTRQIYEIEATKHGENQMQCPECSQNRRKKHIKCFSYNIEKEVGYCNHCETRFVKHNPHEEKQYVKPNLEWQNFTKLSENAVKYFESRGISQKTLLTMNIGEKKEYIPQLEKEVNCIFFPYFRNGELINTKFRDARKNFKLISGAELIWFNFDCIQKCIEQKGELVIVEGEFDALSVIQSGHEFVVSVPNGANIGKMEYFDSSFDLLNKVETFIIAVDNDLKGIELKNELIRRLGFEKCKIANFKEFKDANEYLVNKDRESLLNELKNAKILKAQDVYEVADFENELDAYFENGLPQGKTIDIPELDEKVRWLTGHYATVTGSPTCFTKDTLIHTSLGVKKISEINVGEYVLSYNHDKRFNEYRIVTDTPISKVHDGKLYKIKMKDGTVIKATNNHEFFTGTEYVKIEKILLSLNNNLKK